jgi:hypothetical protein
MMPIRRRFTLLFAAFLIASSFLLPPFGYAQGIGFGLRPEDPLKGYFQFTLAPGAGVDDAVLVVNNSQTEAMSLNVHPVLAYTGLTGGISFDDKPPEGVALWMSLPDAGRVDVPVGKSARLPFTVTVPDGTPPGEYVLGILAAPAEEPALSAAEGPQVSGASGGMQVVVIPQAAVTVIVTVPGDLAPALSIESVASEQDQSGQLLTKIAIRNTGNAGWAGKGELTLRRGGEDAIRQAFNVGYVIGGAAIEYPLYTAAPDKGSYEAEVTLTGGDGLRAAAYAGKVTIGQSLELPPVVNAPAEAESDRDSKALRSMSAWRWIVGGAWIALVLVGLFVFGPRFLRNRPAK